MNNLPNSGIDEHDQHAHRHGRTLKLECYFRQMSEQGASDLLLKAGAPPMQRRNSQLQPTCHTPLGGDEIFEMAMELLTDRQKQSLSQSGSLDLVHETPSGDRFRVNLFRQRGELSVAVRRVNRTIPTFAALHLPPILADISSALQGLVLVTGNTGSGKSTTLASMVEYINSTRRCHIVTIEDPIEYLYQDKLSLVNQREIGIDVPNYAFAVKHLMRQNPDVIVLGEIRDLETLEAAMRAAETGHLVLGTIHSPSAGQTVSRMLELCPPEIRDLMRRSIAMNLLTVIGQKLLPSAAKGIDRVPAVEILQGGPMTRELILSGRESELGDLIRIHERDDMRSMIRSLHELVEKELVDAKVACEHAPSPEELKMLLKGVSAARPGFLGRQKSSG